MRSSSQDLDAGRKVLVRRALSKKNLWENAPASLKRVLGPVLALLGPRRLLGARFRSTLRFLRDADQWDAERVRAFQLRALRDVCARAYERSPYYRDSFDRAGFQPGDLKHPEQLSALPTISKDAVIEHLDRMCVMSPESAGVDMVSTGGTSGVPLHFYIQAGRSSIEYAYLLAGWQRCGYRLGTPLAVFRGRVVPPRRDGLRVEYDPVFRNYYYSTFHMSGPEMDRYLQHISGLGPCFLHVYPSSVAVLAQHLRRSGRDAPANIRGVIAESEIVYPEQRRLVEEVFACRYFSSYGHSEKLVAAAECEHSSDYHVWPTYGWVELIDESGRRVQTPGQVGEIVATGFMNTVMPFIRYRTGDMAEYVGEQCGKCGRPHLLIREIRGHRTQEMLIGGDGSLIPWTAVNMHDDTFLRVLRFQFYQERPGFAELRILPAPGFGEPDERKLRENLARKLGGRVTLEVRIVDNIEHTARGKATYVVQKTPAALRSTAPEMIGTAG